MTICVPGERWLPGQFPEMLAIGDSFGYSRKNLLHAIVTQPSVQDPFRRRPYCVEVTPALIDA